MRQRVIALAVAGLLVVVSTGIAVAGATPASVTDDVPGVELPENASQNAVEAIANAGPPDHAGDGDDDEDDEEAEDEEDADDADEEDADDADEEDADDADEEDADDADEEDDAEDDDADEGDPVTPTPES